MLLILLGEIETEARTFSPAYASGPAMAACSAGSVPSFPFRSQRCGRLYPDSMASALLYAPAG